MNQTTIQLLALAGVLSFLPACGASSGQLTRRAAFDLDCAEGNLTVVEIDGRTRGVSGCGQRMTYVQTCEPSGGRRNCTWVANAEGGSRD